MEAALNVAGVSLRKTINWHHTVWRKVYRNVSRLQVRIVKAFQEEQRGTNLKSAVLGLKMFENIIERETEKQK
ncbi:MAG: hypothetical protein GY742_22030 [Hyphomicrobiales bacterium]|nr:hypothetical protein [Hyphomicrobiales bacterium]